MSRPEAPNIDGAQEFRASRELPQIPEIWRPHFGLIVISGKPGAGTTSTAKRLAAECGITHNLYKAGDTIREMQGNVERAPGFILRDHDVDRQIDEHVAQMVLNANLDHPAIAEAQIGVATAHRAYQEAQNKPSSPIVNVLLWARAEERYSRLAKSAREKGERHTTLEEIRRNTPARERGDLAHWRKIYPWLGNENPLDMGSRDAEGRKFADIEIDNSDMNEEEAYQELVLRLRRMGYLRPKY